MYESLARSPDAPRAPSAAAAPTAPAPPSQLQLLLLEWLLTWLRSSAPPSPPPTASSKLARATDDAPAVFDPLSPVARVLSGGELAAHLDRLAGGACECCVAATEEALNASIQASHAASDVRGRMGSSLCFV